MDSNQPSWILKIYSLFRPAQLLALGYLFYLLAAWVILLFPICHTDTVSLIDNFFTSASAISTTGLTTVNVGKAYSLFGQAIILFLIQMGGIGYMTFTSFVILSVSKSLPKYREAISLQTYSLPKEFTVPEFIRHVVLYTFSCELLGSIALFFIFKSNGVENPLWQGIFHSVSAFCTAGFSLFDDSLVAFQFDLGVNTVISILCLLGSIGFIVWIDLYKKFTRQKPYATFSTKIILSMTLGFLIFGTGMFFFSEVSIRDLPLGERLLLSFFQTMSACTTAGFSTLDIPLLVPPSLLLLLFIFTFGASPSGTGGGLKNTTFSTLTGLVNSTLRGRSSIRFWRREIPPKILQMATSSFSYYMFLVLFASFLLVWVEEIPLISVLFEISSALSTAGLTMGININLTDFGKILISLLMFMGRVGILTFGFAISMKADGEALEPDNELIL